VIITKKHLSRRTVLRGLGTCISLPLLEAMVPALVAQRRTAAAPQFRFGAIYTPNGMCPGQWEPSGEAGAVGELSTILKPFEAFRDRMVVVSGLFHNPTTGTVHVSAQSMWLSGEVPARSENADVRSGTTLDQLIAAAIGSTTPLKSLETGTEDMSTSVGACEAGYSCLYYNTLAWRSPTDPLPAETNPRVVFERLFGETGAAPQRLAILQKKRSILDAVTNETAALQRELGARDQTRLREYLDNIREVEQRIERSKQQAESTVAVPAAPPGIPESFEEHINLMFDLQLIALQTDITRVFTFLVAHEASDRTYPQLGFSDSHHSVSHHGNNPEQLAKYAKINLYHSEQVRGFIEKLRETPDGDGSLLDHVLVMYGSGMSNGNQHDRLDLPIVLLGGAAGRMKGGRHLKHPRREVPLSNLLVAIGEIAGLKLERIGESTGRVDL
jgi:hypothetical protein